MIKSTFHLFLFLILSSCSFNLLDTNNINTFKSFRDFLFLETDSTVSYDFYNSANYSFAIVKISDSQVLLLTLAYAKDGRFTWIGSNREVLQTVNGRIISAIDIFDMNTQILNPYQNLTSRELIQLRGSDKDFHSNVYKQLVKINENIYSMNAALDYANSNDSEKLCISYFSDQENLCLGVFAEKIELLELDWRAENTYFFDENGRVIRSTQHIIPFADPIEITYYLIY